MLNSLVFILSLFVFTDSAPPTPPCAPPKKPAAEAGHGGFVNKNFIMLTITFTLIFCANNGFGIWLGMLIAPFGYGPVEASFLGMTMVISASISCYFVGGSLGESKKYLLFLRLVCIGAVLYQLFGFFVLSSSQWTVWIFFLGAGVLANPIGPIANGFVAEMSYPMSA